MVAVSVRVEAKTSFESPVSALHAEAFVAARILLNMRHDHRERERSVEVKRRRRFQARRENRTGRGEFSQIFV